MGWDVDVCFHLCSHPLPHKLIFCFKKFFALSTFARKPVGVTFIGSFGAIPTSCLVACDILFFLPVLSIKNSSLDRFCLRSSDFGVLGSSLLLSKVGFCGFSKLQEHRFLFHPPPNQGYGPKNCLWVCFTLCVEKRSQDLRPDRSFFPINWAVASF